ncbi:uncharacterized protein LOC120432989 [Oreochromis aureus]|uniref:uncharacterized protein LOC120432989 n=1 Tax=Oreochromis aureus TaxID=47969 RepID=UPI0019547624|nr:uncharacterized protein LOC120432989 [Oreochromis aureus]
MFGDETERKITRAKFDRQSLSANCSVVIKKVTYEDVGRYTCRQFRSGQEVTHSLVDLFVITVRNATSSSNITVRVGDEVTLPCKTGNDFYYKCPPPPPPTTTTWIFSDSGSKTAVTLSDNSQVHKSLGAMSDKLSVTANCSLVIKEVTHEDAGSYTCIQFISGKNVTDYQVDLFVITMVPQQISEIKVRLGVRNITTTRIASTIITQLAPAGTTTSATPTSNTAATTQKSTPETEETTGCWVKFIVVIVGLAALSVTVVSVNIWTKTKGYKSSPAKTDHNETNDGEIYYETEDRPA